MLTKHEPSDHEGESFLSRMPEMPEGYYSGDQPNPHLQGFVEAHLLEKPFDLEADEYEVPAFDRPIETTKATAIYNMHTYWSKKPHDAIRQYIRHYTRPGDLVLDPFCGSGGTALAALMEGRKAIAIDRSPAATFITRNYCTPFDSDGLQVALKELTANVKPEIDWLYETMCDRCGGRATTAYTVYSQVFQCHRCMTKVALFDCIETETTDRGGKVRMVKACPHCRERGVVEQISTRDERFGSVPVLVSYLCEAGCTPKRSERRHNDEDPTKREYFNQYDLAKLREIDEKSVPYWHPDADLAEAIPYRMLHKQDFRPSEATRLVDLFDKRNLWALAAIRHAVAQRDDAAADVLLFALSGVVLNCSRMYRYRASLKGGYQAGTYYLPPQAQVMNVWRSYQDKCQELKRADAGLSGDIPVCISTQTATELGPIPSNSVDHIFTDPPYADKVQYGELNFVWEAWLGFESDWQDEEIIVSEIRGKMEADWARLMRQAMGECYRVLKPGRWLALCYHDTSEGTWALVQDMMAEIGFLVDRSNAALFIDTGGGTYNQLNADKVTKRDLVINFRKPKPGELNPQLVLFGDEDETTFREKAHAIIREYLSANPGVTKDRVYDEVVSRMVRAGQMEAHNFDELLIQVAEPIDDTGAGQRWYLLEDEESRVDEAETAREDEAAAVVTRFVDERLHTADGADGVHYSDVFEHYLYTVDDRPRRELAEWLPDYFYKTDDGTWRSPQSEEELRLKADGRARGVNRRIKRYLSYLEHGLAVPESQRPTASTLADWIRHAKRSGLYDQGRMLYEKGGLDLDALPESIVVDVEEDYQTCIRMLSRASAAAKPKRARKVKEDAKLELDL